jgi:hypothetical protein
MRAGAARATKPRITNASDTAPTDARHRRRRRVSGASWQRRSVTRATAAQPDSRTAGRALAAGGRAARDDLGELVLRSAPTRPGLAMTSAFRMKGLTLELSGSQRRNAFGCPLGRRVMRSPTDEGTVQAGHHPTPTREPRRTNPRAAACHHAPGSTQGQDTARAPHARRFREQAGLAMRHSALAPPVAGRAPRCDYLDTALPPSASEIKRGHNVRHERQTQAQLEAVRSMEGLAVMGSIFHIECRCEEILLRAWHAAAQGWLKSCAH